MPITTCSLKLAEEMAHEIVVSWSSVSLCKTLCLLQPVDVLQIIIFFEGVPGLFRVRFPAGNAHFSTPFNTQGTSFSRLLLTYSICPKNMIRRKVAEPYLFLDCSSFYLIAKTLKLICSKIPRGNSKTFLLGYTHIKPVPSTPSLYPQILKGITPLHFPRV